jgi:hypothetical protein
MIFKIPVLFIAPYSGNTYINYSYIPFSPDGSIVVEVPIYLIVFFVADSVGRALVKSKSAI